MYVDTHCHITSDDYDDIPKLIDEIYKSGVEKIIVNGCDMKSNLQVLELIKEYDIVYGAIGFHPTELEEFDDSYFEWLENHINDDKIIAVGEIGLDYHYDCDKELQKELVQNQRKYMNKNVCNEISNIIIEKCS